MNYLQIDKSSISNGPGVRVVLWVSGCTCKCKGCQNPESWDFNAGKLFDEDTEKELFKALNKPYIQGITFSGGHPIERRSIQNIDYLIRKIRDKFPDKDIWMYTGLHLSKEDFGFTKYDMNLYSETFKLCDVIVDGPYIEEQRDITLKFRGSKNQRLIDVKETLKQGEIITIQN